jgi:hypothetical protein
MMMDFPLIKPRMRMKWSTTTALLTSKCSSWLKMAWACQTSETNRQGYRKGGESTLQIPVPHKVDLNDLNLLKCTRKYIT